MENIAQMVTQPWMVFVFVSIILLVALRPFYQAIFSIGAVNGDLDEATKVLSQLGKNQQDEFYDQFKNIHAQILRIPGLRHAWREFVDSMYFESVAIGNNHRKAYISDRPDHYFNRESVLGTRLSISQFLAYPNYLIGIGLTFTFIGLAAALHVAQAGLASGAGQQALKDLLAVASIKFISSIVGIASSLFISALQRIRIRVFQQKLNTFCDLLEECTKYKSTEKLLHDGLSEQRTQTALLNDLGKNIALGINEAINDQLSAGISQALQPLVQDIRSLAQNFTQGSEAALSRMLAEFTRELHKNSAHDMQGLMDSTRALKDSLDGLAAGMESAGRDFNSDIKNSATRLAGTIENFTASFAPVQSGITQFGNSLSSLEAIAAKVENASDNNRRTSSGFEKAIADISTALAPVEGAIASLSQSLGSVREAGASITAAAEIFRTSSQGISGAVAVMEKTSRQVEEGSIILKERNYFVRLVRWFK